MKSIALRSMAHRKLHSCSPQVEQLENYIVRAASYEMQHIDHGVTKSNFEGMVNNV